MLEEQEQVEPENTISTQMNEAGRINLPASFEEVSAQVKQLESSCEELKVKCARLEGNNSCHVRERRMIEEQLKETMMDEDSFRDNSYSTQDLPIGKSCLLCLTLSSLILLLPDTHPSLHSNNYYSH